MTTRRTENWMKDGVYIAVIDVTPEETVVVSYSLLKEMLKEMLTELGWKQHTVTYTSDGQP